jgi:membrane-associated phospholipid phosphatase
MKTLLIKLGANYLFAVLVVIGGLLLLRTRENRGEKVLRGIGAGVTGVAVDKISGLFYYHARPFEVLHKQALALNPSNNAFPSDHALLVFTAAFVVWAATKNWKFGVSLLIGGVVVGWARVLALVHWPVDILGSFVIAALVTALWFMVPLPAFLHRAAGWMEQFMNKKLPNWLAPDYTSNRK